MPKITTLCGGCHKPIEIEEQLLKARIATNKSAQVYHLGCNAKNPNAKPKKPPKQKVHCSQCGQNTYVNPRSATGEKRATPYLCPPCMEKWHIDRHKDRSNCSWCANAAIEKSGFPGPNNKAACHHHHKELISFMHNYLHQAEERIVGSLMWGANE